MQRSRLVSRLMAVAAAVIALAAFLVPGQSQGTRVEWITDADGAWDDPANWSTGSVPGPADDVIIDRPGATVTVTHNFEDTVIHSLHCTENLVLESGTLSLEAASDTASLTLIRATLTGPGDLTVTGKMVWQGGWMTGSGTTGVQGGIEWVGAEWKSLEGRTLINEGNASWMEGNVYLAQGARFENRKQGVLEIQGGDGFVWSHDGEEPLERFVNLGLVRKSQEAGTATLETAFDNRGTVEVRAGALKLAGGGEQQGRFDCAAGTEVLFDGDHTLQQTCTLAGDGSVRFLGGTSTWSGASSEAGSQVVIEGGEVAVTADSTLAGGLTLNGGILTGAGTLTVGDKTTWRGGWMKGSGATLAQGGIELTTTETKYLEERRLVNGGNASWSEGDVSLSRGARFENGAQGVLEIKAADGQRCWYQEEPVPRFVNQGTVRKRVEAGTVGFQVPFDNQGTVEVQAGNLRLEGGGEHAGRFECASGSEVQLVGSHALQQGSVLAGAGLVRFVEGTSTWAGISSEAGSGVWIESDAEVAVTADSTLAGGLTLNGGTLAGSATLTVGGRLDWIGGWMKGGGTTIARGGMAWDTAGARGLQERRLVNEGVTNWTDGFVVAYTGGRFENRPGGVLDIQVGSTYGWLNPLPPAEPFLNEGVVRRSRGDGTLKLEVAFDNRGRLEVEEGTLKLLQFTQTPTGALEFGLAGTDATQYGQVQVEGVAALDGALETTLLSGFQPAIGDSFALLSWGARRGYFSSMPDRFRPEYSVDRLTLVASEAVANDPPSAPALLAPASGATVQDHPTLFQVSGADPNGDRLWFLIEILRNGEVVETFDQTLDPGAWDAPSYAAGEVANLTASLALAPGDYAWRARAFDGRVVGPAGETQPFLLTVPVLRLGIPLVLSLRAGNARALQLDVPSADNLFVVVQSQEQSLCYRARLLQGDIVLAEATAHDQILRVHQPQPGQYLFSLVAEEGGDYVVRAYTELPAIAFDRPFVGTIYHNGGFDWAQMEVPQGIARLEISVDAPGNESLLEVWRGDLGSQEYWRNAESFDPPIELAIDNPPAGRYYLRLQDHGNLVPSNMRDYSIMVTAPGGAPLVAGVSPARGGNTGPVTLTITGRELDAQSAVKLVAADGEEMVASEVSLSGDGTRLLAVFDLTGAAPGVYDVVVTPPQGEASRFEDAFTVESGGEEQFWVELVGRSAVRVGRLSTFTVLYGNRGSVDSSAGAIRFTVPQGYLWELPPGTVEHPDINEEGESYSTWTLPGGAELIGTGINDDGDTLLVFRIPPLPPGASGAFQVRLGPPSDWMGGRAEGGGTVTAIGASEKSIRDALKPNKITAKNNSVQLSGLNCSTFKGLTDFQQRYGKDLVITSGIKGGAHADGSKVDLRSWTLDSHGNRVENTALLDAVKSQSTSVQMNKLWYTKKDGTKVYADVYKNAQGDIWAYEHDGDNSHWDVKFASRGLDGTGEDCFGNGPQIPVHPVQSQDPNEIVGPAGIGENHHITSEAPLAYSVFFENRETATAAAQEVIVTLPLDPAKVDLSTFNLGPMGWGDHQVTPPPGKKQHVAFVDLRPGVDLVTRVEGKLDEATGLVTWRFVSLDPATGEMTEDPDLGFLPPNRDGVEGQGMVEFHVMPKGTVASGTEITAQARIVFDVNPPIDTNLWSNTIDSAAPSSQVQPLPERTGSVAFPVQWGGQDDSNGSGLAGYDVYVSEDSGPWVLWLQGTRATSEIFRGQYSRTYAFVSRARDQVDNQEALPAEPDARTQVGMTIPAGMNLIGIPLLPEQPDPALAMGFSQNRWARWDPAQGRYVRYGEDAGHYTWLEPSRTVPGKGFWVRYDAPHEVDTRGTLVEEPQGSVAIPLQAGWNMVGNPWPEEVAWRLTELQVRKGSGETVALKDAADLVDPYAWLWKPAGQGRYMLLYDERIIPGVEWAWPVWSGAWLQAKQACELLVPAPERRWTRSQQPEAGGWSLALQVQAGEGRAEVTLGVHRSRALAAGTPPPPPEGEGRVRIASLREGRPLAVDVRRGMGQRQVWELLVEQPTHPLTSSPTALTWPDLRSVPADVTLTLVDTATGQRRYLRTTNTYTYQPTRGETQRRFQVIAERGRERTLQVKNLRATPTRGGAMEIRFSLSRAATTTVRVRTLTGQTVSDLERYHPRQAMEQVLHWDRRDGVGRRLPAGVYLIEVYAEDEEGRQVRAVTSVVVR